MRRYLALSVLAILVGALAYQVVVRGHKMGWAPAALGSRYRTEEHWLLSRIATDIAQAVLFAKNQDARQAAGLELQAEVPAADGRAPVHVSLPGGPDLRETITLRTSIWSPEDFAPFAQSLLQVLHVTVQPSTGKEGEALLGRLLDVGGETLEAENALVSSDLAARPADPQLHEEAALILGVLGLREVAGDFQDVRFTLCRMTTHLALARALRAGDPQGLAGRYADVVRLALMGRGADAEAALAAAKVEGGGRPIQDAWVRLLTMRITHDWRVRKPGPDESSLEALEGLRATLASLGISAWDPALPEASQRVPDFGMLAVWGGNVEWGQSFTDLAPSLALKEASRVFELSHHRPLADRERADAFNSPAQLFVTDQGPAVIAWGTWAAFYQRHICFLMEQQNRFYRLMFDLPKEAAERAAKSDHAFAGLTLYPLVRGRREVVTEAAVKHLDDVVDVVVQHPELVTLAEWGAMETVTRDQAVRRALPLCWGWFAGCPRGTTLDFDARGLGLGVRSTPGALKPYRDMAPKDDFVADAYLTAVYGHAPDPGDVARELGPRLDYDIRALRLWQRSAGGRDRATFRRAAEKQCELNVQECLELSVQLAQAGEEDAAAVAFDKAFEEARDRIGVARRSTWMVQYNLRHGHKERARQIAEAGAQVYSGGGLRAMATYLEATQDYAAAEDYIHRREERYPDPGPRYFSIAFYYRMAFERRAPGYEAKFEALAKDVFPAGVESVSLAALTGQPEDGVAILRPGRRFGDAGLRGGEIIVGVDGHRVRTKEQLRAASSFKLGTSSSYIVWQAPRYREIKLRAPDSWPEDAELRTQKTALEHRSPS